MSAEQPCRRYSGITRHVGKWLVKLRHRGQDVTIGHYEDPEDAAWAADFARYLLLGVNPRTWHHNVARPNSPPGYRQSVNHLFIMQCLAWYGVVPHEVLMRHWEEYQAAVDQDAPGNALAEARL